MMSKHYYWIVAVVGLFGAGCGGGGGGGDTAYTALAEDSGQIGDMVVDSTHAYWVNGSQGWVKKVPLDGGEVVTLATGQASPSYIAVGGGNVYWTLGMGDDLMMVPANGGTPTSVLNDPSLGSHLAVDATHAYWRMAWKTYRAPLTGGTAEVICDQGAGGAGMDTDLAVGATHVYWSSDYGVVWRVPLTGGTEEEIANHWDLMGSYGEFYSIALDSTHLYWSSAEAVGKVPLGGGQLTLIASGQPGVGRIAMDSTDVYWINGGLEDGTLMRAPRAGGTPTPLASELGVGRWLAVDASRVIWSTSTAIRSISKY